MQNQADSAASFYSYPIATSTGISSFGYDTSKDLKNKIFASSLNDSTCSFPIKGSQRIIELLKVSQPSSIFSAESSALICYKARVAFLKRALILPNSYELFLSPWLADGSFSYPHDRVRTDWKNWFPSAHHAKVVYGTKALVNTISDSAFDGTINLLDYNPKFVIKNHVDANNYWHWTFEWLPRIFELKRLLVNKPDLADISFINIGSPLNKFQSDWLSLVLGPALSFKTFSSPILCNRLIWITPPFPSHHSPEILREIRNYVFSSDGFDAAAELGDVNATKLFVLRGSARNGRRILNEFQLSEDLKKLGFTAIAMDGLSIYQQAFLFANAKVIVGAHGSAFVNMIFSSQYCKIIELFGPGYLSGHDYSLACVCGLYWEHIEGEVIEGETNFSSDFVVNADHLISRVECLIQDH